MKDTSDNPLREPYGYFITKTERLEIRTLDDLKYVKLRLKNLRLYFRSLKQNEQH